MVEHWLWVGLVGTALVNVAGCGDEATVEEDGDDCVWERTATDHPDESAEGRSCEIEIDGEDFALFGVNDMPEHLCDVQLHLTGSDSLQPGVFTEANPPAGVEVAIAAGGCFDSTTGNNVTKSLWTCVGNASQNVGSFELHIREVVRDDDGTIAAVHGELTATCAAHETGDLIPPATGEMAFDVTF